MLGNYTDRFSNSLENSCLTSTDVNRIGNYFTLGHYPIYISLLVYISQQMISENNDLAKTFFLFVLIRHFSIKLRKLVIR